MTKSIGLKSFRLVAVVSLVSLVVASLIAIISASSAHALSRGGPDTSDFGGQTARYALQDTSQLRVTTIRVPVYFPTNPGTITVTADNFNWEDYAATPNPGISLNGTNYYPPVSGGSRNFNLGGFVFDSNTGYYSAYITARLIPVSGGTSLIDFRLTVPAPGIIGYSATSGSSFAVANEARCGSNCRYYNYVLPFATQCNTAANQSKSLVIYDGDNGASGIQPSRYSVTIRDETDGTSRSYNSPSRGSDGNGGTAYYDFTAIPYHKYTARVNGVFANNVMQIQLPYDSIYALVDCQSLEAKDRMYGSWVEYGIFSVGIVRGTGSGSAFAGPKGLSNTALCDYSKLTFVNTTTSNPRKNCSDSTTVGGYSTGRTIPNIAANFPIVTSGTNQTPTFDNNAARPQGLYTSANNLTIGSATTPKVIAKGQWAVINAPNADVTIAGDILYDGGDLQSIGDIPQLVIIAKNIFINPNVKQVDAWLIAKGTAVGEGVLDTCRINPSYAYRLTNAECVEKLTVNGPVMAQHLWLRRTAGSGVDDASGDPAEVFNIRPDSYLWAFARASTTGRIESVYSNELPPRF